MTKWEISDFIVSFVFWQIIYFVAKTASVDQNEGEECVRVVWAEQGCSARWNPFWEPFLVSVNVWNMQIERNWRVNCGDFILLRKELFILVCLSI